MAEQPGSGDVHVDGLLTNMSIAYQNEVYIAERIFTPLLVNNQSDIVPKYDQSDWFRNEAQLLGDMDAPPVGGFAVDVTDTYFCHQFGIAHYISDNRRANQDQPYNADNDGMEWLVDKILMAKEQSFVTDFWKTSVWGSDETVTNKWNDYGSSTPIEDIRGFKRTIRRRIARNPNKLVLGDLTFDRLEDHPDLLARIQYGSSQNAPAMVTPNLIAQLLGLDEVLVGTSIYTADEEGTAEGSVTYTANWDDDGLLLYVPSRPSLRVPAAGYTIIWRTVFGGGRYIRKRREPLAERGDLLEAFESWDMKATATRAGSFLSDMVD